MTYTCSLMPVNPSSYEDIKSRLDRVGYQHTFHDEGDGVIRIDMTHIMIVPDGTIQEPNLNRMIGESEADHISRLLEYVRNK